MPNPSTVQELMATLLPSAALRCTLIQDFIQKLLAQRVCNLRPFNHTHYILLLVSDLNSSKSCAGADDRMAAFSTALPGPPTPAVALASLSGVPGLHLPTIDSPV